MRISTTTLESFRLFRAGFKPEAELIAQVTGDFRPTWRVLLGRAYGRVLEDPDGHRVAGGYACDRFRFEANAVDPALAVIDRRGLFEVKATKRYDAHTVVAKVDYIRGADVEEFKTRIGSYDPDRYMASYQWRFELDVFEALSVTYRVFRLTERLALRSIEALPLYPYPALQDDCRELVDAFVWWVGRRGLETYLADRDDDELATRRVHLGEAFEDAPARPTPDKSKLRALKAREEDVELPYAPFTLQPVAPVATLPDPAFTLRPPPAGRVRQPLLF